ncbi:MAG: fatty acid desaturase [Gemmatimonadales bacterium]|nr:fatty acid desaturase [Gemmatimonadales bacterium]
MTAIATPAPAAGATRPTAPEWNAILAPYRQSVTWKSAWQLANTLLPFVAGWALMAWSLGVGYWFTLLLAVPTAMLLVRMFMFQHDCGHGSFFRSRVANDVVGSVIGVLTLVPYTYWRKTHALHHAGSGDLEARGFGDIDTLTVREYLSRSPWQRVLYRAYRHPLTLLVVGPLWQFVIKHRWPVDAPRDWKREWASVHWTNLAIAALVALMVWLVGWRTFLLVQLPVTLLAGTLGVYLFYVQHQYEDTYWRYRETWDFHASALEGASHLTMPKVLQWFTASIGLHHIHHLASRIPNYNLQRAFDEVPALRDCITLPLHRSLATLRLTLWDEDTRTLLRFRDLRAVRARLAAALAPGEAVAPTKSSAVPPNWRAPSEG